MNKECQHREFYYYLSINEEGWKCVACGEKMPGEPPGYRPDLDRKEVYLKVGGILNDLHNQDYVYVSNGTGGDILTDIITAKCKERGVYDQYSIILFILEEMTPGHAEYWKEISDGIMAGNDPRDRCYCGKLANRSTGNSHFCSMECEEIKTGEAVLPF